MEYEKYPLNMTYQDCEDNILYVNTVMVLQTIGTTQRYILQISKKLFIHLYTFVSFGFIWFHKGQHITEKEIIIYSKIHI